MKIIKIIILLVFLFTINLHSSFSQTVNNTKQILDSFEVLKKLDAVVIGFRPGMKTEERYFNNSLLVDLLPFHEIEKLLKDKDPVVRGYGFTSACKKYIDSLTPEHLKIFNDKSKILFYSEGGNYDPGMTLGEYCSIAYTSTQEEHKSLRKQPDVEAAVRSFIVKNAAYPSSYQPIEFTEFSFGDDFFEIRHRYKIKNNKAETVEANEYFVTDTKFMINVIETINSGTINAFPPETVKWFENYGKKKGRE